MGFRLYFVASTALHAAYETECGTGPRVPFRRGWRTCEPAQGERAHLGTWRTQSGTGKETRTGASDECTRLASAGKECGLTPSFDNTVVLFKHPTETSRETVEALHIFHHREDCVSHPLSDKEISLLSSCVWNSWEWTGFDVCAVKWFLALLCAAQWGTGSPFFFIKNFSCYKCLWYIKVEFVGKEKIHVSFIFFFWHTMSFILVFHREKST